MMRDTHAKAPVASLIRRFERRLESTPLFASTAVVSMLFALCFLFFTPYFDTSGDGLMCLTTAGAAAAVQPDEHIWLSNILVGLAFRRRSIDMLTQSLGTGIYLVSLHFWAHVASCTWPCVPVRDSLVSPYSWSFSSVWASCC